MAATAKVNLATTSQRLRVVRLSSASLCQVGATADFRPDDRLAGGRPRTLQCLRVRLPTGRIQNGTSGNSIARAANASSDQPVPALEVYDPATNEWTTLIENQPADCASIQVFAYQGQLLYYGIHPEKDGVATFALLDPTQLSAAAPAK